MVAPNRTFNLPYLQHEHYRLSVVFPDGKSPPSLIASMLAFEFTSVTGNDFSLSTANWQAAFALIRPTLSAIDKSLQPEISLFCGLDEIEIHKTFADMCALADSVWLGEALQSSRLVCYMQPVCAASGDVMGYESFARVQMSDGSVLAGDKIMQAGKILSIEFAMDKFLHTQAIATFAKHNFSGDLFVNFFPGFIQRPAIYLEGLLAAAEHYHIPPSRLVLDLTQSETRSDVSHLAKVCEYAKTQGCKIALDDVESLTSARKLLPITKADFIKIDRDLVHKAHQPGEGLIIASMVELAAEHGAKTIGEGVETPSQLTALVAHGVDFFQGYHFAAPMAAEQMLSQKAS